MEIFPMSSGNTDEDYIISDCCFLRDLFWILSLLLIKGYEQNGQDFGVQNKLFISFISPTSAVVRARRDDITLAFVY